MRQIHINETTWQYQIGASTVKIRSPEGKCSFPGVNEVKGGGADVERGRHKGTSEGMVKPSDVRAYIETHLLLVKG